MAREEYIRIYRSDVAGATPSLTSGEIAANLVDGKLFIGGTNGSLITFTTDSYSVTGVNGLTGNVSITGDGGAVQGKLNNTITTRLTTAAGATGLASFRDAHFLVDATGHVQLATAYQVTGQTVVAGYGIDLVSSGNTRTINNRGVTSFNGLTGNVSLTGDGGAVQGKLNNTITVRVVADNAMTGIASFDASHFAIGSSGHVRSKGVITINGQAPNANGDFTVAAATVVTGDGGAVQGKGDAFITARVGAYGVTGVASFDSRFFGIGTSGHLVLTGSYQVTGDTIQAGIGIDIGSGKTINNTGVLSFNGITGYGISITGDGGAILLNQKSPFFVEGVDKQVTARIASTSVTGVASFVSTAFNVSTAGVVTLADGGVGNKVLVNSGFNILDDSGITDRIDLGNTLTLTGGGGVRVRRTGTDTLSVQGVTASATVLGIASFDPRFFGIGSTGHLVLTGAYQVTGDTVITVAGSGIGIVTSGNTETLYNIGVTSFNGLTGNVSLTGDGGAVQGRSNNIITARLTTAAGATGLASFRDTHFLVDATGHVQLAAAYQVTGQTVVAGYGIDLVASGNTRTINNRGVTSFNGLTGNVSLTGDGGAVQGKLNNSITVRVVGDNAMTGVASFDASHFAVGSSGHVRSKGVITINSQAPDANGNFTVAAATVVTGDGGAIQGEFDAFITARLSSYTLTGVASYDPRFFGIGSTGHLVLTGAYQVTGDTVQAGSGIVIGTGKVITNSGVTGVTTGTLSYGQAGVNGIRVSSLTGNIVIENTGVRALTVQGYSAVTTPTWYQKGPQIRSSSGISVVAAWDNEPTLLDPYINISNTGVLTVNGLASAVTLTGDGGAVYGVSNNTIAARHASYTLTGVASFDPRFFGIGSTGHLVLTGSYAVTGDTVVTVSGSGIGIVTSGNTETLYNIGVTSFNGLTGNVSLTGDGGAVQGKDNSRITTRFGSHTLTGIASFDPRFFGIGSTGHLVLTGAYQVTGDTVQAGSGIAVGTGKIIYNIGVTGIGLGSTDVGLTGKVNITAGTNITFTRSGNTITIASSAGGGATGDTILPDGANGATSGAIWVSTVSGNTKMVTARHTSSVIVTNNGIPSGQPGAGTSLSSYEGYGEGNVEHGLTGVGYFDIAHFVVKPQYGLVQLRSQGFVGGGENGSFSKQFTGLGASSAADGSLSYLYFDVGNLTFNSATTLDPTNDFVLFYDASETGLVKTKRMKSERILLDNDSIFNSKSTQFVKSKSSTNIEFEILTAPVTVNETKLLKSGDAFTYIAQNTVKSLNGATGDVTVVGNINGCTGAIVITGTANEVVVSNSCPNITIGLPDNVNIPYLSGTGATFTQTVTATRFIGIVSGGNF